MVQSVKCLPLKHEDLRLDPQHPQTAGHCCSLHLQYQRWGGRDGKEDLWACWPGSPAKLGSCRFSKGSRLHERWIVVEKDTQC